MWIKKQNRKQTISKLANAEAKEGEEMKSLWRGWEQVAEDM